MKKLTSERLGREGLAAWEDRKSNADPEIVAEAKDDDQAPVESVEEAESEAGAEQDVPDEEAQTQRGTKFPRILILVPGRVLRSSSMLEASVALFQTSSRRGCCTREYSCPR